LARRRSRREVAETVVAVAFWLVITGLVIRGIDVGISGTEMTLLWGLAGVLLVIGLFRRRRRAKRERERPRLP